MPILFRAKYYKMLKDVKLNIQAQLTYLNKEALAEQKDNSSIDLGKLKPKLHAPKRVDKKGYQKARVIVSFPNFINTIYKYQVANLKVIFIISSQCKQVNSLSQDNLKLSKILKNPTNIKALIIFNTINNIYKGLEKMLYILFIVNQMLRKTTTTLHLIN